MIYKELELELRALELKRIYNLISPELGEKALKIIYSGDSVVYFSELESGKIKAVAPESKV